MALLQTEGGRGRTVSRGHQVETDHLTIEKSSYDMITTFTYCLPRSRKMKSFIIRPKILPKCRHIKSWLVCSLAPAPLVPRLPALPGSPLPHPCNFRYARDDPGICLTFLLKSFFSLLQTNQSPGRGRPVLQMPLPWGQCL